MNDNQGHSVVLKAIDMPFWDLVRFLLKLSFVAIPATIIYYVVITGAVSILGLFLGYFSRLWLG